MRILLTLLCAAALSPAQPRRIVSTAPAITETLFAIGAGPRVVGISTFCHFPAEAMRLPKVGTYLEPNVEVIARLNPDLVLVEKLPTTAGAQIQALSIPVVEVATGDLEQNLRAITAIGEAAGAAAQARQLTASIRNELAALRKRGSARTRQTAVFVVGRTPGRLEGLVVVGGGSYLTELMGAAGGHNVYAGESRPYLKTSLESILRRDPDVLIDMGDMADTSGVSEQHKRAVTKLWSSQPTLRAVRKGRVHAVASDIWVVPGPRMIDAARAFHALFHPEQASQ